MVIKKTIVKAGSTYKVDASGPNDVVQHYQVVLQEPLDVDELPDTFSGVPALDSEHPDRPGLYVVKYEVTQPDGEAKSTLDIAVHYGPSSYTETPIDPEAQTPTNTPTIVSEWGWDDGTGERELVESVGDSPVAVLNSAGDPFESVPTVSTPTPTFTKVLRMGDRIARWGNYFCCVNSDAITIGGMACPARTLLCTISEKKIIGEAKYPYEYTVHLKYRSNKVRVAGAQAATEIGWDVAIVDAGMREKDSSTGKLKLIQVTSEETGQPATVTSPELLNGSGQKITRTAGVTVKPYILVFQAYPRVSFPSWFYSEPPTPTASDSTP